jgi:hypothetical protein
MRTPAEGVASLVHQIGDRSRRIARLEAELAVLELRQKASAVGVGAALLAASCVLALFGLGFLLAAVTSVLAMFLPAWGALLIVGGALVGVAAVCALGGRSNITRGVPPVPEQALDEARHTAQALRGNGHG